jgi:heptosyltransferase-2
MLIAAPVRWDDACFAIPAVRALAGSGLRVGVLCGEAQQAVWETVKGLAAVIAFAEKANAKSVAAEISGKWEAAMIWEDGVAAESCVRAKVPKRIGPDIKELRKLVTNPIDLSKAPGPVEHRVQFYLSLVEKLGIPTSQPEFFGPAWATVPQAGTVLLSPDSDFGKTYEWPFDRWVELGKALLPGGGAKIKVAGLPGNRDLGTMLAAALGESVELIEAKSLAALMPVFAAQELVVTAESSLPHVASHAGTTCVTLFGPGDPAWRRPLGRRHGVARRHVECSPCFLTKCPMDLRCQNDLTVARVLAAVREKLPVPVV